MSEIDEIKADEEGVMTSTLIRAFRAAGCDPACHCCFKTLKEGDKFKLAKVETMKLNYYSIVESVNDEMLCEDCTPRMLKGRRKKQRADWVASKTSGFTRKHISITGR